MNHDARPDESMRGVNDAEALARYYDLDLQDDPGDLPLYQALAKRTGGPILELGVGSGRLAVPLARAGYAVTGVDRDPHMLARAEMAWKRAGGADRAAQPSADRAAQPSLDRAAQPGADRAANRGADRAARRGADRGAAREAPPGLRLVEADMVDVRLPGRFALAILALNTLLLLDHPDRQLAAVRTLAHHLRRDGLAVIDVWLPSVEDLVLYDGRLLLEWQRDDIETGDLVTKFASARHDAATASVLLTQLFDVVAPHGVLRRVSRTDRLRLVGAHVLIGMARDAGLAVEQLAGDHQMTPFGPGGERVVLVARLV
jgi:SAM-dependent methyltransferase